MEQAEWIRYRGHFIVERRSSLLGRRRYDVWKAGQVLGTFRDPVRAEIYVDGLTAIPLART